MSIFSFFKHKKQEATVKKAGGKPFRKDIQALRAFAVATVVLYHLWPNRMVGGFAGVDIFFVISGFLMTTSVMGHLKPHITDNTITVRNVLKLLAEFYARRIRRLVPAALTTLSGALILAYFTNNLTIMVTTAKNVIASATFWENWHLAQQSVDYLHAGDAATATEHFWSLSVEEQFYLMWPLLLVGATLLTINIAVYYKKQRISGIILPITLLTLISFAYGYWLTHAEPSIAYFSTPARIWELMLGGIIAFLPVIKNYDLKLLLPHVGLAMCLYSVFFITGDGFPGWHALIPTLGTAMIIWAGIGKAESRLSFNDLFALKPIQWIGNISYSVYLWHFPLIVLLPVLIHRDIDGPHGKFIKLGIIVLSIIAAQLSYMYVEETTRKIRLKLRYVYLLFFVATGIIVGGGFALQTYGNNQIDTRLKAMHAAALDENNLCFGARAIVNKDKCDDPYGKFDKKYSTINTVDDFKKILSTNDKCTGFNKKSKKIDQVCEFGDLSSNKIIVLIGDSHAQQFINTFDAIGIQNNYKIVLIDGVGCLSWWQLKDNDSTCENRLSFIENSTYIKQSSFVVLSFLFRDYSSVSSFIERIKRHAESPVVLIKDIPKTTIKRFNNCTTIGVECKTKTSKSTSFNDKILKKLEENQELSTINIVNIDNALCDKEKCYQRIGELPIYLNTVLNNSDVVVNSHITASFAYTLYPVVEQQLKEQGLLK